MKRSISFSYTLSHSSLILVLAATIWLPWAMRNIRVYGDITAERIANIPAK
jgi:hypothetical protein